MKPGAVTLTDLTAAFEEAWDRTAAMPTGPRLTAFKAHFANRLPGLYDHQRFGGWDVDRYDGYLLQALNRFPEERAGISEVRRRFPGLLARALKSFEDEFGTLAATCPVYLVHSLGEFDGGTRSLPGGRCLLFGADVIARLHLHHDPLPFLHHELLHLYHERRFAHRGTVWCDLWCEGLATFVASRLNPHATDDELLLNHPEPIRAAVDRDRPAAIRAVLDGFESTDAADREALFNVRGSVSGLPPRVGYYVGYLALAQIGEVHAPKRLADMPAEQVHPLLRQALEELAEQEGPQPGPAPS